MPSPEGRQLERQAKATEDVARQLTKLVKISEALNNNLVELGKLLKESQNAE